MITRLRQLGDKEGLEKALAIGELVLSQFFDGDPKVWHDRRRNKDHSVRRLAGREDCPLSRSVLNDAIGIYVAALESPCVRTFGHVRANHVAAVLKLSPAERESMLRRAEECRWSVRELRENVTGRLREMENDLESIHRASSRGQESTPAAVRSLAAVADALAELAASVSELASMSSLDDALRPNIEKLARELIRIRSDVLKSRD